jgi:excisionase family DNA binding protein
MDNETKTLMTMEQASTFTEYSIKYLYKLVHDGTIPYYKLGNTDKGKVIFCKEELTEWIFRNRRATEEEIRLLEAEK